MMKKTLILLIVVFIVLSFQKTLLSQYEQSWVKKYIGLNNRQDIASDIKIDLTGNIIVAGNVEEQSMSYDMCFIKYNSQGDTQWTRIYNSQNDGVRSIAIDNLNNIYAAGLRGFSRVILKYSSSGILIWEKILGEGQLFKVGIDAANNVYVTGIVTNSGSFNDFITSKVNSNGVLIWEKYYFGSANLQDYPKDLKVDLSGNVYVTGYTNEAGNSDDYCTLKYNTDGTLLWAKKYNGPGNSADGAFALSLDTYKNVYVSGYSTGSGSSSDFCTIKYDSNGTEKWVKRYNGPSNSYEGAWVNFVDNINNIYVGGQSPNIAGGDDYCLIKYSNNGDQLWVARYNGPGNGFDGIRGITSDSNRYVFVTGISTGSINLPNACTIKYDSSGNQLWLSRYNSDPYSISTGIIQDNSGNVIITGSSVTQGRNDSDIVVIKYSSVLGIQYINSEIPIKYSLKQNYPNPFNPQTNIQFSIPEHTGISLKVYNSMGIELIKLAEGDIDVGNYIVYWDASNFPSGVYFYKIVTDGFTESKKMILVK